MKDGGKEVLRDWLMEEGKRNNRKRGRRQWLSEWMKGERERETAERTHKKGGDE